MYCKRSTHRFEYRDITIWKQMLKENIRTSCSKTLGSLWTFFLLLPMLSDHSVTLKNSDDWIVKLTSLIDKAAGLISKWLTHNHQVVFIRLCALCIIPTCDKHANPLHLLTLSNTDPHDQRHDCNTVHHCQIFDECQIAKPNHKKHTYNIF